MSCLLHENEPATILYRFQFAFISCQMKLSIHSSFQTRSRILPLGVGAYLSDQFVVQLSGDRLRSGQPARDLHCPLVQVLSVPVRRLSGKRGAENGKNTAHHHRTTSHFHVRGNSTREEKYLQRCFDSLQDKISSQNSQIWTVPRSDNK